MDEPCMIPETCMWHARIWNVLQVSAMHVITWINACISCMDVHVPCMDYWRISCMKHACFMHNIGIFHVWYWINPCVAPAYSMHVIQVYSVHIPGWKGPRRLVVAVRDFALFSGFGGCVQFTLNCGQQPGDNECDRAWKKWDNGVSTVNEAYSGPRSRMLQPRFRRFERAQSWSDSMIF